MRGEVKPLNFLRIFAISLFILFSSSSRTRAPRMSAMNWEDLSGELHRRTNKTRLRQPTHVGRHFGSNCMDPQRQVVVFCLLGASTDPV